MKQVPKITIKIIDHQYQRYDTAGDWWIGEDGAWHIVVSDLIDPRFNFLIVIHELVELALCQEHGISQEIVDAFDIGYSGLFRDDPGDDPYAPYHQEHVVASAIETIMAVHLGINWSLYEATIEALPKWTGVKE